MAFLGAVPFVGVIPAVASGLVIGLFNGYLVAFLGIPSLIITLGSLFIFRGLAYMLSEGFPFSLTSDLRESLFAYGGFGSGEIMGFNNSVLWLLDLMLVLHLLMFTTPFGNRLLAVGGDASSALSRGVRIRRMKLLAFIVAAGCAAFAGVLQANKIGFADGTTGRLMELEAIAACVVGGCALASGRMTIIGTLVGAFVLSSIQSYLVIMGITPQLYLIVLAAFVVAASLLDSRFRHWAMSRM